MKKTIYNALVFNVAWLICVFGGDYIAVPTAFLVIAVHCYFFSENPKEILLILVILVLGVLVDSALIRSGLLLPPGESLWPPWWLVCLWGLFATTLNHSLKWFQTHALFAVVLGGVAGSMTYLAGTRLSDFSLKHPQVTTLAAMFVVWACVFPLCLWIAKNILQSQKNHSSNE